MKPSQIFTAFSTYCFLFIDGFPVVDDEPRIIGPDRVYIYTHSGNQLMLHCEAFSTQDDVTLIYWLVNGTFPEDTSNERIVELDESTALQGEIIKRDLFLKKVTKEDFKRNFTCVVTNAFGTVRKFIKLTMASHCKLKNKHLIRLQQTRVKDIKQST